MRGKGYGKESLATLRKHAFENFKCKKFWLDVYPSNQKAISLYEKTGLGKEGLLRQIYKSENDYHDAIIYSMLRSEYYKNVE